MENIQDWIENHTNNFNVMNQFENWIKPTQEFFCLWIHDLGGFDEWMGKVWIVSQEFDYWSVPVPTIETQFGNYTYDPHGERWLDDDQLEELISG